MTVWDNVAFGPRRSGLPAHEVAERVEAMLKLVQLGALAKRKPHQLSGGQQQRVALARSLAKKPQLLLLDEPLGALDKKLREQTQIELVNIVREVGVTCVMVTHDQEEAMTMASRIAVMSEGRFLQVGTPAEIYETPANRFVADFIGNVNLMDGRVVASDIDVDIAGDSAVDIRTDAVTGDDRSLLVRCADCIHDVGRANAGGAARPGMQVTVALRPEKIRISREPPRPTAAGVKGVDHPLNRVRGTVKDLSYFGSFTVYHLQLASGLVLKISAGNADRQVDRPIARGDDAWASWAAGAQVVRTA